MKPELLMIHRKQTDKKEKIIVFSNSLDEHTHIIVDKLKNQGAKIYRVDTDRYSTHFKINLFLSDKPYFLIETPVGEVHSDEVKSVWIRRPYILPKNYNSIHEKLIMNESYAAITGLVEILPDSVLVVDKFENVIPAEHKPLGLYRAAALGLAIPDSIVTSSEVEAKKFIDKLKGDVITKALDIAVVAHGGLSYSIPTSKIKEDADLSSIKYCPTLLQKNINKKEEMRIIVIGDKVFPIAFNTQHLEYAKIDTRMALKDLDKIPHRLISLPNDVEIKLLKLVRSYKLHFAAIDMAITPEEEYVFFELNPAGQFLWLDFLTPGLDLGTEMANYLNY